MIYVVDDDHVLLQARSGLRDGFDHIVACGVMSNMQGWVVGRPVWTNAAAVPHTYSPCVIFSSRPLRR